VWVCVCVCVSAIRGTPINVVDQEQDSGQKARMQHSKATQVGRPDDTASVPPAKRTAGVPRQRKLPRVPQARCAAQAATTAAAIHILRCRHCCLSAVRFGVLKAMCHGWCRTSSFWKNVKTVATGFWRPAHGPDRRPKGEKASAPLLLHMPLPQLQAVKPGP
jgi:hypothetical protein